MSNYTLVHDDHMNNNKREGVCIYYKSCQPLRVPNISQLNYCFILEIKRNGKSVILSTLCRSPSQSTDEFDNSLSKFEENLFSIKLKKPFLTCILSDFNAKSSRCCANFKSSPKGFLLFIMA